MAATEKRQMWLYSGDMAVVTRPIAASQGVYMAGAICYISASGTVKLGATSANGTNVYHGILLEGVSAALAANTMVKVGLLTSDQLWCIYCENNGTDSAVAQANVGNDYGLTVSATATQIGYTTLDLNSATYTAVQVYDIMSNLESSKYTTSDVPGVAVIKFLDAAIQEERA